MEASSWFAVTYSESAPVPGVLAVAASTKSGWRSLWPMPSMYITEFATGAFMAMRASGPARSISSIRQMPPSRNASENGLRT